MPLLAVNRIIGDTMNTDMDTETLIKKAKQSIKLGDYKAARQYLKQAASLAPMRTDIREMLEFTIQQRPLHTSSGPQRRGLFQSQGDRSGAPPMSAAPGRSGSLIGKIIGILLTIFVTAGCVTAFFLLRPRLITSNTISGGGGTESATTATAVTAPTSSTPAPPTPEPTQPDAAATADSLMSQGKYNDAVQTLKTAIESTPSNKDVLTRKLTDIQFTWGKELVIGAKSEANYDQAIKTLQEVVEIQSTNAEAYYWLGQAHLGKDRLTPSKKDLKAAEKDLLKSVEIDPNFLKAYEPLGRVYSKQDKLSEAAKYWKEVIKRAPDSTEAARAKEQMRIMDLK